VGVTKPKNKKPPNKSLLRGFVAGGTGSFSGCVHPQPTRTPHLPLVAGPPPTPFWFTYFHLTSLVYFSHFVFIQTMLRVGGEIFFGFFFFFSVKRGFPPGPPQTFLGFFFEKTGVDGFPHDCGGSLFSFFSYHWGSFFLACVKTFFFYFVVYPPLFFSGEHLVPFACPHSMVVGFFLPFC